MAGRETAGAVIVTIDGDASPLLAKYQQAEAQSRAAGQRIAGALGSGFQQSTGIVDQYGKAVQSVVPPLVQATEATEALGAASTHSVSEIQAMSGALRTLEGNGGLRAAERFLATTLGLGGAVQAIFPIIGLVAVAEMLDKVISKFSKAHEQTEEFKQALQETGTAARGLVSTLDDINVEKMRDAFGGAAGERMQATVLGMKSMDKLTEAAGLRGLIASAGQNENFITKLFGKPTDIDAVKQKITALSIEAQDLAAQSDAARNRANTFTGPKEAAEAAKKAAEERKREAAEAQRQKDDAFRQEREFMGLVRQGRKITADEEKKYIRESNQETIRGLEQTSQEFEHDEELKRREIVATTEHANRLAQERIRAHGLGIQSDDEIATLQIKQAYSLQIVHTRAEELKYAQDIAVAEQSALSDRIASLELLRDFQTSNALYDEANRTDLDIERAKAELRKQEIQDATRIALSKQQGRIGGGLAGIAGGIPGQLGGALAGGITGGHIGQEIKQALTGIGKEMMGDVFKDVIAAIIGNSLVTLANTAATELNTFWLAIKSFVGGLLGFAGGGRPAPGVPYVVGENGPEIRIDDGPGVILPNVPNSGALGVGSSFATASAISNSSSNAISVGALHVHGVRNVEEFARRLPSVLKSRAPVFSPATR